jgi:hypothetical protein
VTAGSPQMFAALDLASGQMFYRFRDRKRWREFLDFLKQLRTRFPVGRLYIVCDNFSPHHKAEVATWEDVPSLVDFRWRSDDQAAVSA